MSIYRKKADIPQHLPRAFYSFGIDLEAIQFSYFLGTIKTLNAQLLNNKNNCQR